MEETHIRNKSYKDCNNKLRSQFFSVSIPSKSTLHQLVNNYQ